MGAAHQQAVEPPDEDRRVKRIKLWLEVITITIDIPLTLVSLTVALVSFRKDKPVVRVEGLKPTGSTVGNPFASQSDSSGICQMRIRITNGGNIDTTVVDSSVKVTVFNETVEVPAGGRAFALQGTAEPMMLSANLYMEEPDVNAEFRHTNVPRPTQTPVLLEKHRTRDVFISLRVDWTSSTRRLADLNLPYNYSGGPIDPSQRDLQSILVAQYGLKLTKGTVQSDRTVCFNVMKR